MFFKSLLYPKSAKIDGVKIAVCKESSYDVENPNPSQLSIHIPVVEQIFRKKSDENNERRIPSPYSNKSKEVIESLNKNYDMIKLSKKI